MIPLPLGLFSFQTDGLHRESVGTRSSHWVFGHFYRWRILQSFGPKKGLMATATSFGWSFLSCSDRLEVVCRRNNLETGSRR